MSVPSRPYRLRAVLFDFDGTLTLPGAIDFPAIKRAVGCPPDVYLLEHIDALADADEQARAHAVLERHELEAAAAAAPNDGAEELVGRLHELGLKVGVLTRNGRSAVLRALERFARLDAAAFDVIVTRDDDVAVKPAPDGVLFAAEHMGVPPRETLVVGDYTLDMQAGRAAGAVTAYLTNGDEGELPAGLECDAVVHDLAELDEVVRLGLPLPAGKLPAELLAGYLAGLPAGDRAGLLVAPGVGEDVAALELDGAELLAAHGDPITLAGAGVARFAVAVNANDIATAGAEPRWLLATVLLPPDTSGAEALALLRELQAEAAAAGIALAGGHTEVSDAVTRPVVSLTTLGTVSRGELREKRAARAGDRVVLTKACAVEGTALLAQELGERLRALGMSDAELGACTALLDQLSVVPEARIARGFAGVRAMHDVTEGGLATALRELGQAARLHVIVDAAAVPVLPLTRRVCKLLGADPLGLIGSGSLLIVCAHGETQALVAALEAAGIRATVVAELGAGGPGVDARRAGAPFPWPAFAVDEAARLLGAAG